jgi:hypothetical protein
MQHEHYEKQPCRGPFRAWVTPPPQFFYRATLEILAHRPDRRFATGFYPLDFSPYQNGLTAGGQRQPVAGATILCGLLQKADTTNREP